MTFKDRSFQLVVFDPPHITRQDAARAANPTGNTLMCYGALHSETEQYDLHRGFSECWRVLAPGGTLVFKWAGELARAQPHFPATPIVGTKTLRAGSGLGTRWLIFYKPLAEAATGGRSMSAEGASYEPYVVSDERLAEIRAMFTERDEFDSWDLQPVPGVSTRDLVGAIYDLLGERDDR
jgi:SAM-dependent methyltransferase